MLSPMTKPMPIMLFGNEYWKEVTSFDTLCATAPSTPGAMF